MEKQEKLKLYSQKLRKQGTKEENTLWYQYLRTYPVQFRRQCVIGSYIVDFYCAKALLVVELDGSQHYSEEGLGKDAERTQYLESLGLQVLRFSNTDINRNLSGVCQRIDWTVAQRIKIQSAGLGRSAFSTKEVWGGSAPHPPPCGGTFPPGGRL